MISTGLVRPAPTHDRGHPSRDWHGHWDWHKIRSWLRPAGAGAGGWRRVARELAFVAVFLGIYELIRETMVQAGGAAASHALSIVSAERSLGLFHEQAVQELFIKSGNVMDVFNAYYGGTHFLVPAVILAWLLWRHPGRYASARTTLALATAIAFACFWLYPVAPPRLLPARFGIVDTLTMASPAGHAEGALISAAGDQYASMPSLHVAWAVWCAVAVYPLARHWAVRLLAVAYPVMTALVVVATGNHFFFDVAAGAVLTGVSWVTAAALARGRQHDKGGAGLLGPAHGRGQAVQRQGLDRHLAQVQLTAGDQPEQLPRRRHRVHEVPDDLLTGAEQASGIDGEWHAHAAHQDQPAAAPQRVQRGQGPVRRIGPADHVQRAVGGPGCRAQCRGVGIRVAGHLHRAHPRQPGQPGQGLGVAPGRDDPSSPHRDRDQHRG